MILPEHINRILSIFEDNNYQAYLVGGYIRDTLLGIESFDYDIVTDASISDIEKIFNKCGAISKKNDFFMSCKLTYNGYKYDITTMRTEGPYNSLGYPSSTTATKSIIEDLSRRDFTINSIAYSISDGLIDPYNGIRDLHDKIIRNIKDPEVSYKEDPTRIIRAYRFAEKLGFEIFEKDRATIEKCMFLLKNLTQHQKEKELQKLSLDSPNLVQFFNDKF